MRFLVDAQLPPALARLLREHGHVAEHVGECGLGAARDGAIWLHADRTGSVIVTKDEDFARRRVSVRRRPLIIWIRLPNTRRRQLLSWFEERLPTLVAALQRGETLIEIVGSAPSPDRSGRG